ncbi:unnamed protein product, partial [Prorocentrum cordatum]
RSWTSPTHCLRADTPWRRDASCGHPSTEGRLRRSKRRSWRSPAQKRPPTASSTWAGRWCAVLGSA